MSRSNIFWKRNSCNRTPLDTKTTRTIKFKTLFPNYTDFVTKLAPFGLDATQLTEVQFNRLRTMVANSWLKYKTDVKNYAYIALKVEELYSIQVREQKIYDFDPATLMNQVSSLEQRFFSVNKTSQGVVTDDFLNNSNTSKQTSSAPFITQMNELMQNTQLKPPALVFLYRLANAITYPLQHNTINEFDREKSY